MNSTFDFAVIGAGMAGASIATEIGDAGSVVILEAEAMPGYHATGRSAAFWEECYGGPDIVPLTLASGPYLRDNGFLTSRGSLYLAQEKDQPKVDDFFERFADTGACFETIDRSSLVERVPGLLPDWDRAIWQSRCADIDVAGLHAHYLSRAKKAGAHLLCNARVAGIAHEGGLWMLSLTDGRMVSARTIINAAGAWADNVAAMVGARDCGIQPLRRTVVQLRTDPAPPDDLPLCLDISGGFYFKPDNGKLWLSPHDETPSEAADVAPEELDVALAIDRFEKTVDWKVEAVERKWAGLRSFSRDRLPVYGFDPEIQDFFWFAGQGGYGIQTAPAAAMLGAQLLLGRKRNAATVKLCAERYSPSRFV